MDIGLVSSVGEHCRMAREHALLVPNAAIVREGARVLPVTVAPQGVSVKTVEKG